jgi:hypothetical protein
VGTSTYDITDVSVHAIPGNHAYQITTTKRPLLSARVNLLTYSEDFTNVAWTKTASTTVADFANSPIATLTADKFIPAASAAYHFMYQSATVPASAVITASIYAKYVDFAGIQFEIRDSSVTTRYIVGFDISLGTFSYENKIGSPTNTSYSITSVGSGWYRIVITATLVSYTTIQMYVQTPQTFSVGEDGIKYNLVWGAQLELGSVATTYQWITASTTYNTAGFKRYLKFDGVDDFLQTNNVPFVTDKLSYWCGFYNTTLTGAIIMELGPNSMTTAGTFWIDMNPVGNQPGQVSALHHAGINWQQSLSAAMPIGAKVLCVVHNLAGNTELTETPTFRLNTSTYRWTGANGVADSGSSNFTSQILYLGSRAGLQYFFSGNLYSLIIRGSLSDPHQIISMENYVNALTGAF